MGFLQWSQNVLKKSLYGLLDTVSKLDLERLDSVWILNHISGSITVSIHSKSIKLGQCGLSGGGFSVLIG